MSWIEIDAEVLAAIEQRAEPFFDSPNDALRRALGLAVGARPSRAPLPSAQEPGASAERRGHRGRRARAGELLPLSDYELPLLRALSRLGGSAPRSRVADAVEEMLGERLKVRDREPLQSGEVRWENRLGFARRNAVERGHLRPDSRRGIWALTEAGIERLGRLEQALGDRPEEASG